jgi:hypothetical protein
MTLRTGDPPERPSSGPCDARGVYQVVDLDHHVRGELRRIGRLTIVYLED